MDAIVCQFLKKIYGKNYSRELLSPKQLKLERKTQWSSELQVSSSIIDTVLSEP